MVDRRINQGFFICIFYAMTAVFLFKTSISKFEFYSNVPVLDVTISILNIGVSIIGLAFSLSASRQQLNMCLFWIFQFVFLGITPLLTQLDRVPYYLNTIFPRESVVQATQIILVAQVTGLIAQITTYYKSNKNQKLYVISGETDMQRLLRRTNVVLFWYSLLIPLIILQLGGFRFLFKRVRIAEPVSDLSVPLNAILLSILYVIPLVCGLTLIFLRSHISVNKFQIYSVIGWVILLSNPLGNARQTTLFLIVPLIFYVLRKRRVLATSFFLIFPLLLVYSGAIVNRYDGSFQTPRLLLVSRSGDFDAFSQLANGLKLVSQGEFPVFRQMFGSIFFFLPRSLWQNKPNDTGVELARLLQLRFQNLSAPWILEAYVNLRMFGVITASLMLAFFLTRIDLNLNENIRFFLVSSMSSGLLFIVLRGSLLQATGRAVFTFVFIFILTRKLQVDVRDRVT